MLVRAGATNREMVRALGVDIRLLYTVVFGLGALLAGLAGLMAAPLLAVQVGMGEQILILTFVVVVIGGVGSVARRLLWRAACRRRPIRCCALSCRASSRLHAGSEADALGAGISSMGDLSGDGARAARPAARTVQCSCDEKSWRGAALPRSRPGDTRWASLASCFAPRSLILRTAIGDPALIVACDPHGDLCHRGSKPQSHPGLWRACEFRPCGLFRRRRLCRRHPHHFMLLTWTRFLGFIPGTDSFS